MSDRREVECGLHRGLGFVIVHDPSFGFIARGQGVADGEILPIWAPTLKDARLHATLELDRFLDEEDA